jgi:hypothetical protein
MYRFLSLCTLMGKTAFRLKNLRLNVFAREGTRLAIED